MRLFKMLKQLFLNLPGIIVEITPEEGGPGFSSPIELGIFGNNEDQVAQVTQRVEKYLQEDVARTYKYKLNIASPIN